MKPTWGTYVTVEDLDAALQKVETLGGKVLIPPVSIPPASRFALIQDPQGAAIAVISYGQP
ncbi:MAG: VOC family protein [Cyanobacteriota bacterium]|nr:VOC family protein [Cyanobacteriota bacterium]